MIFLLLSADFFQNHLFKKFFQEHYQSVKQFGSRSLFAKVISRLQKSPLAKKDRCLQDTGST